MSFTKILKRATTQPYNQSQEVESPRVPNRLVWGRPDRLLTAPFQFMRSRGKSELQNLKALGIFNHLPINFTQTFDAARKAIQQPPQWESIQALETDWNIDTTNRKKYLWIQRVYVALLSVVLFLVVLGMLSLRATSLVVLISSFIVSFATCLVLLLVISISLWRIDVLHSRRARHYVSWLCKR